MKRKNSIVKKKSHNFYLNKLKNNKIKKAYSSFKKNLNDINIKKICVAISGGPDSLALAFFCKCLEFEKKNIKTYFFIVDHKLKPNSTIEANLTKKNLKKFGINCEILSSKKRIVHSNIQAIARKMRYDLLLKKCEKNGIKYILTAHHKDDLYENLIIRLLRGSGLKGLSSINNIFSKVNKEHDIYIIRSLLNISKKDLLYTTNNTFKFFLNDISNANRNFLRVRLRMLISHLKKEGLDFSKLKNTISNLNKSNETIEFYTKSNIKKNTTSFLLNKKIVINQDFFEQPYEVIFRSLSEIIYQIGNRSNFTRGRKLEYLLTKLISSNNKIKLTLSGCIIEKIGKTVIITQENAKK